MWLSTLCAEPIITQVQRYRVTIKGLTLNENTCIVQLELRHAQNWLLEII